MHILSLLTRVVYMCLMWEPANNSEVIVVLIAVLFQAVSQSRTTYVHNTATYSIKLRLHMSCTIINSNTNIATGNDMKGYRRWTYVLYSGKLSRERTFMNFAVLWLFVKVFSVKFGDEMFFGAAKLSNPQKFFIKNLFFTSFWKFSPSKVSRYTVYIELKATVCYICISAHVSETTTLRKIQQHPPIIPNTPADTP